MRNIFLLLSIVVMSLLPLEASAFHVGEQVETMLSIQNDFVDPDQGGNFNKYKMLSCFEMLGNWSFGGEVLLIPTFNYLRFRPYASLKFAPVVPLIGLSTDSKGADYINAGIQYFKKFGSMGMFIDVRNYWGLNGSVDFTDNFATASFNINDKIFASIDLIYDHYWKSEDNWGLVGISLGYKVADNMSIFVRPAYDVLSIHGGGRSVTRSLRTGIKTNF